MSRKSQRRKDWDIEEDFYAEPWQKKSKKRQETEWMDDEKMYRKRHNHRNKKKSY